VHVLEHLCHQWLAKGQQLLQKGNRCGIHISNYMLETHGHLVVNADEIAAQAALLPDSCLHVTDARKIIYPGKNTDKWWDLPQLMEQLRGAVDIFEYLHLDAVGIWAFDCLSAHEGLASEALNVNKMNVKPGGKQTLMQDNVIPDTNLPLKPGQAGTCGLIQSLVYPNDHPDFNPAGKVKGMRAIVKERVSVYDKLVEEVGGKKKVIGKCESC
jgi:hypothetical protein